MLSIRIELNHVVVIILQRITSCCLKSNRQATVNKHINYIASQTHTKFESAIPRAVVNDDKVKLRGHSL